MLNNPRQTTPAEKWTCRGLATLAVLVAAALHLFCLARNCPLDLAPDEAHYWDWSRHLDWSYYSKGPLVAWLIRLGCEFFGGWSETLVGSQMLAVRLPALLCGVLLLWSLYILTVQSFASERLALLVVLAGLTLPLVSAGASLMTIDAPYACCWGWALVCTHRALFRGSRWAWSLAGVLVGLGILAKYTMVLFLPSLGLFLLLHRDQRERLLEPGFWMMSVTAGLCCLPILLWNFAHDWVSVKHVNTLAGMNSGPRWFWRGPIDYVAGQCALLLVFWFCVWACAMIVHRPWREPDARLRYLWWLSAPMFGVFFGFSFKTGGGELNWPVTTYLSGLVLASGWLVAQLRSPRIWYRWLTRTSLGLTCAAGLLLAVLLHRSDWYRDMLLPLVGEPTAQRPLPLRRFDPTCRLAGWRTLASEVDAVREALLAQGVEPVLVATSWSLPGEIGFYCDAHPTVYNVGVMQGERHNQYDFWRPNPVADASYFLGRTFVIVGNVDPGLLTAFEQVEDSRVVYHREKGQPLAIWGITVAHGFRGFPQAEKGGRY
jgi:hypothetical protein